jgi:hypothetical protein
MWGEETRLTGFYKSAYKLLVQNFDANLHEGANSRRPSMPDKPSGACRRCGHIDTRWAWSRLGWATKCRNKKCLALRVAVKACDLRLSNGVNTLADGHFHKIETRGTQKKLPGLPAKIDLMRVLSLIPWLTIERSNDNAAIKLVIDTELRAICEARSPRPEFNGQSLAGFFKELRATITRRRQENNDNRSKAKWHPDQVSKREQSDLLDYIEQELDRAPL